MGVKKNEEGNLKIKLRVKEGIDGTGNSRQKVELRL